MGILELLGGIDTGLSAFSTGYNIFSNERAYRANRSDIAWEREQYINNRDYNRALQQQIFEREDTAIQRAVQDAGKAGLSPLSVAGGNGAGSGAIVGMTQAPSASSAPFQHISPMDVMGVMRSLQEMTLADDANERANKQVDAEIAFQNAGLALDREKIGMEFALKNAELFNNLQMNDKRLAQEAKIANDRLDFDRHKFIAESNRWLSEFSRAGVWRNEDIQRYENQFKWNKGEDTIDNIMNFGNLLVNVLQTLNGNRGRY